MRCACKTSECPLWVESRRTLAMIPRLMCRALVSHSQEHCTQRNRIDEAMGKHRYPKITSAK